MRSIKSLFLLFAVALLPGCAMFAPQLDRAADKGADLVVDWCDNFSAASRQQVNETVNNKLPAGYSLHPDAVTCPDE